MASRSNKRCVQLRQVPELMVFGVLVYTADLPSSRSDR